MKYDVVWEADAIDALQQIYDTIDDREGLLNTIIRVGLELAAVPKEAGESRDEGERVLCKHPLIVWFRIHEQRGKVAIFKVRRLRQ